jgi:hypothetical protein
MTFGLLASPHFEIRYLACPIRFATCELSKSAWGFYVPR